MKLAQAYRVGNLTVVNNNNLTQYITLMAHYIETYCPLERLSAEKAYQKQLNANARNNCKVD